MESVDGAVLSRGAFVFDECLDALSANMTETLTPLGITVGRWRFNRWQQRENRWH